MQVTIPAGIVGSRIESRGTPGQFGTVERARVMDHAFDPIHVELIVAWESGALERSRIGVASVRKA